MVQKKERSEIDPHLEKGREIKTFFHVMYVAEKGPYHVYDLYMLFFVLYNRYSISEI